MTAPRQLKYDFARVNTFMLSGINGRVHPMIKHRYGIVPKEEPK